MNYQKLLLATLGGAIVFFFAGWLIWGFALYGFYDANTMKYEGLSPEMPNMIYMSASMIVHALLFSYIFLQWAGIKTFVGGAKAGALLAVLMGLGMGFMMLAQMNLINMNIVLVDIVGNLIWGALGGGVIGYILGRGN